MGARARGWLVPLIALLCAVAVAGCGTGSGSERADALTIALAEDPDELDPTISSTFVARIVFAHMCEKLYDVGDGAERRAAARLRAPEGRAPTGRPSRSRCARALKFNDGTAFDAAAVKQSLDRHRTLEASSRSGELEPVSAVEVVDDHTVRLKLTQRFAPLTSLLADRAGMIMSPKALDALGDKFSSKPVCVGPFKFKERVASDRIVLERAPDYYDADKVSLREITFKIITEGPVRASNLRSGDVDVASAWSRSTSCRSRATTRSS